MRTDYTHITMLLDRSGSMEQIRSDVQGGIDKFVSEQRTQPGEATFALYTFDDQLDEEISPRPIADVGAVTLIPRGRTALLDAMGKAITKTGEWLAAKPEDKRPEKVVFAVITDGLENASVEWTRDRVLKLVTHQRDAYQWEFLFLAANQDAIAAGGAIGVPQAGAMNYAATSAGVGHAFAAASASTSEYRGGKTGGVAVPDNAEEKS
jgi:uncharacterized protein YegL